MAMARELTPEERRVTKRAGALMAAGGTMMLIAGGTSLAWGSRERPIIIVTAVGLGFLLSGLYRVLLGIRGI